MTGPEKEMALSPLFKLVFFTVLSLTVLAVIVSVLLISASGEGDAESNQVLEAALTTWKLGFGAVAGLVGGKAA